MSLRIPTCPIPSRRCRNAPRDQKFNFVWLDDGPKQEMSKVYGPVATPHVFIFDKARKLRFEGRIDDSERESTATKHDTRAAIDALLAGKTAARDHHQGLRLLGEVGRQGSGLR